MSFSLRMRQVVALRVVQREAEFTFIRTQMVLHKVRVFIEIDRFQGELPQSFPPIKVGLLGGLQPTAAMFRVDAVLVEHRVVACRWLCAAALRRRAGRRLVAALVSACGGACAGRGDATGWLACFSWLGSGASRRLRIGRAACQEMCRAYQSCSLSIYRRAACKADFAS